MTLSHNLPPLLKDIQTFVAGSVGELGSFGVSMRPSKVSQLKEELPGLSGSLMRTVQVDIETLERENWCRNMFDFYQDLLPDRFNKCLIDLMNEKYGDRWLLAVDECHSMIPDLGKAHKCSVTTAEEDVKKGFCRPKKLEWLKSDQQKSLPMSWPNLRDHQLPRNVLLLSATPGAEVEDLGKNGRQVVPISLEHRPTNIPNPEIEIVMTKPNHKKIPSHSHHDFMSPACNWLEEKKASIARPGAGEEFLDGCLRLKGFARSIDVHFIMVLIHRLQKQLLSSHVEVAAGVYNMELHVFLQEGLETGSTFSGVTGGYTHNTGLTQPDIELEGHQLARVLASDEDIVKETLRRGLRFLNIERSKALDDRFRRPKWRFRRLVSFKELREAAKRHEKGEEALGSLARESNEAGESMLGIVHVMITDLYDPTTYVATEMFEVPHERDHKWQVFCQVTEMLMESDDVEFAEQVTGNAAFQEALHATWLEGDTEDEFYFQTFSKQPFPQFKYKPLLHHLCEEGTFVETLRFLLSRFSHQTAEKPWLRLVDVEQREKQYGNTAFHICAYAGHVELLDELVKHAQKHEERSDLQLLPSNVMRSMPYTAYIAVGSYALIFWSQEAALLEALLLSNELLNAFFKKLASKLVGKEARWIKRPRGAADSGIYPQHFPKMSTSSGMPSGHAQTSALLATVFTCHLLDLQPHMDPEPLAESESLESTTVGNRFRGGDRASYHARIAEWNKFRAQDLPGISTSPLEAKNVVPLVYVWLVALCVMFSRTRFGGPLAVNIGGRAVVQHSCLQILIGASLGLSLGISGFWLYLGQGGWWLGLVVAVLVMSLVIALALCLEAEPSSKQKDASSTDDNNSTGSGTPEGGTGFGTSTSAQGSECRPWASSLSWW
eukprot:g23726.t1